MRLFFILVFTVLVSANTYQITSFNESSVGFAVLDNSIVKSTQSNGELPVLKTMPTSFSNEQLVMRVRYGVQNYTLYSGRVNSNTYKKLQAFRLPGYIPYTSSLKLKFYKSDELLEAQDIAQVYFDGSLVYTESYAKLYCYFDNEWVALEKLQELPGRVEITSNPSGADLYIDGVKLGQTPFSLATDKPALRIKVVNSAYYASERFVYITSGSSQSEKLTLKKKVPFGDGSTLNLEEFSAENSETVEELEEKIRMAQKRLTLQKQRNKDAINTFKKNYAKLAPKDQFETTQKFNNRKAQHEMDSIVEYRSLKNTGEKQVRKLEVVLVRLVDYMESMESRIYTQHFSTEGLSLGRYNADLEFFPATISINESHFNFSVSGKIHIPLDAAKEFFGKVSQGRLKLRYYNRLAKNGNKGWYASFEDIKLEFKDREYAIAGKTSFPSEVASAKKSLEAKRNKGIYGLEGIDVGRIILNGIQEGTKIILNGEVQNSTGKYLVPVGKHEITLEHPEFQKWSRSVTVNNGDRDSLYVRQKTIYGSLSVTTDPSGAMVTFRGISQKSPALFTKLQPATKNEQILIELDTYKTIAKMVTINSDYRLSESYTMKHTTAYLDSIAAVELKKLAAEEAAAKKKKQITRRVVFGLLASAGAGVGYLADREVEDRQTAYMAINDYDEVLLDSKWQDVKKAKTVRAISYSTGIAFGTGFILSIPF